LIFLAWSVSAFSQQTAPPDGFEAYSRFDFVAGERVIAVEDFMQDSIGDIRVAVGAPDTRNKLLTEGKWVTRGILFDVNSDRVKPESYGALKEISAVLAESPDLKVQIIGHTDSDGDAAQNLDLSKRRAAAVRAALSSQFGIDGTRLTTDGKGATQPIDNNQTSAGKANNRRVEFIKM
jgi:outer membrane protein OmpA-like peptidoglycan-associated protein